MHIIQSIVQYHKLQYKCVNIYYTSTGIPIKSKFNSAVNPPINPAVNYIYVIPVREWQRCIKIGKTNLGREFIAMIRKYNGIDI